MFERIRNFCGGLFEKLDIWTERHHQRKLELIEAKAASYSAKQAMKEKAAWRKQFGKAVAAARRMRIARQILQGIKRTLATAGQLYKEAEERWQSWWFARKVARETKILEGRKTAPKVGLELAVLFLLATLVGVGIETYYPWTRKFWPHTMILSLCCFYLGRLLRKREIFPALRRAFLNPLTIAWFMAWLGYYFR